MNQNGATDYTFKHYEDISQYMRDYRCYHTCKQTGYSSSLCHGGRVLPASIALGKFISYMSNFEYL